MLVSYISVKNSGSTLIYWFKLPALSRDNIVVKSLLRSESRAEFPLVRLLKQDQFSTNIVISDEIE